MPKRRGREPNKGRKGPPPPGAGRTRQAGTNRTTTIGGRRLWLERLIFGGEASRRFTQDSPVLPDVLIRYGMKHLDPDGERARTREMSDAVDLLLTPHRNATVPKLGRVLRERLADQDERESPAREKRVTGPRISALFWAQLRRGQDSAAHVAYNQATVAARLYLDELVRLALPLSRWWGETVVARPEPSLLLKYLERLALEHGDTCAMEMEGRAASLPAVPARYQAFVWFVRVVGTLALIKFEADRGVGADDLMSTLPGRPEATVEAFDSVAGDGGAESPENAPLLWTVSLNRPVRTLVSKSSLTVKADAARQLFQICTDNLTWAIIDSGVDAAHAAFQVRSEEGSLPPVPSATSSRVEETYDFTRIRTLLAAPSASIPSAEENPEEAEIARRALRRRLRRGLPLDWGLLRDLLRIPKDKENYIPPLNDHGTHVAGILAGEWRKRDHTPPAYADGDLLGVCPKLRLYDLRVLDENGQGSEFSVLAALQFVRWLNTQYDEPKIQGVNLSISMKHDVANYACGRTPVCEECDRVVASGVVVVAAAGNDGYTKFATPTGDAEGYRSISIADPGNAESVITVGATHRNHPHAYGVSYFSSRGPTGDGRRKPDLVAPGEKITAPTPGGGVATKDGTSMAAPHVSGAAVLLMARHRELMGEPQRIKEILCATATDLRREPYFQGHGLVDILRAMQSV